MRAALPSRSPTTTFSWAAATRKRGIDPGYEGPRRCARHSPRDPLAGRRLPTPLRRARRGGVDVHGEAAFVMRWSPGLGARRRLRNRPGRDRARAPRRRGRRRRRRRVDARAPPAPTDPASSGTSTTSRRSTSGASSTSCSSPGNVPLFTPRRAPSARSSPVAPGTSRPTACWSRDSNSAAATRSMPTTPTAAAAGLVLAERFSTWAGDPFRTGDDYAVSVHRFADR